MRRWLLSITKRENIQWLAGITVILTGLVSAGFYIFVSESRLKEPQISFQYDPHKNILVPVFTEETTRGTRNFYERAFFNRASFQDLASTYQSLIDEGKRRGDRSLQEMSWLYTLLGSSLLPIDMKLAIEAFTAATDLDESSALAHLGLGMALLNSLQIKEGLDSINSAETLINSEDHYQRAIIDTVKAFLIYSEQRDKDLAFEHLRSALSAAEMSHDEDLRLGVLLNSVILHAVVSPKRAQTILDNSIPDCGQLLQQRWIGMCFHAAATIKRALDQDRIANEIEQRALISFENSENWHMVILVKNNLAQHITSSQGWEVAESWLKDNLTDAESRNYVFGQIGALLGLSSIAGFNRQDHLLSLQYVERAINLARRYPDISYRGDLLRWAATRAQLVGQNELATEYYEEAYGIAEKLEQGLAVFESALALWAHAADRNDAKAAGSYQNRVEGIYESINKKDFTSSQTLSYAILARNSAYTKAEDLLILARDRAVNERNLLNQYQSLFYLTILRSDTARDKDALDKRRLTYARELLRVATRIGESSRLIVAYRRLGTLLAAAGLDVDALNSYENALELQVAETGEIEYDLAERLLDLAVKTNDKERMVSFFDLLERRYQEGVPAFAVVSTLRSLAEAALVFENRSVAYRYARELIRAGEEMPNWQAPVIDYRIAAIAAYRSNELEDMEEYLSILERKMSEQGSICGICEYLREKSKTVGVNGE